MSTRWLFFSPLLVVLASVGAWAQVGPVSPDRVQERSLDPWYRKQIDVAGFPILGSAAVSNAALREAAWILENMLTGRLSTLRVLAEGGVHLTVMARTEYTTDVPEHKHLRPRVYWDRRARGLGGSPVSCAEENLLNQPGDPYAGENILIHEFAHAIHSFAMPEMDPTFDTRLRGAYRNAVQEGLWVGTYAGTNAEEYWAEAVQSWFDNNRENDALHNHVNTRSELQAYDSALANLCSGVFGEHPWRYRTILLRPDGDRAHLAGYAPEQAPTFRWREEPVPERPQVRFQTSAGDLEIEFQTAAAPDLVEALLAAIHRGECKGQSVGAVQGSSPGRAGARTPSALYLCLGPESGATAARARVREHLDRAGSPGLGAVSIIREGSVPDMVVICAGESADSPVEPGTSDAGPGAWDIGRVGIGREHLSDWVQALAAEPEPPTLYRIQRAIRLN